MLTNTQYDEFREWVKVNQTSYRLVNMSDAPREGAPAKYRTNRYAPGHPKAQAMSAQWLWRSFLFDYRLVYIPDHSQFIFAKMFWS